MKFDGKPAVWFNRDIYAGSREGGIDDLANGVGVPNLEDRLDCCRQIRTVMAENGRAGTQPRNSRWRIDIRPKLVVEPPTANRFP